MDRIEFREVQRFRQPWLWTILVLSALGGAAAAVVAVREPGPTAALIAASALPVVLFCVMKLDVEVRPDVLRVRYVPLRTRRIRYADIRECHAVTYRPILDYGGWGIRWGGPRAWAYNVSGNRGVLLDLADGSTLLIGSQRPEELAASIRSRVSGG